MENDLVPKAGYELLHIHSKGLNRGFSLKNVSVIFSLFKGIKECKEIIRKENPDLVIGTGGYVTAPLMIAGKALNIPTLIHESNALPGKTTSWLSTEIDTVALGFEEALKRLPKAKNAVYTGNPTKMRGCLDKKDMKNKLGFDDKPVVLIFGGSQGAKKINEIMLEIINEKLLNECNLVYATGTKNYDEIISQIDEVPKNVKIEKYIYNMEEMMAASDLLVCRSGALTTSEIGICGVPAILIPFPYAAENHQYYNAKTLENVGAGIIIEEKNLTKELLCTKINELVLDKEKLNEMGKCAKRTGNSMALKNIEAEIDKLLNLC